MKKHILVLSVLCFVLLGMIAAYAQHQGLGGFTGPSGGARSGSAGFTPAAPGFDFGKIHAVTVEGVTSMPDDALVSLKGNIVRSLGDEKYAFRDATGEIVVEIDKKVWRGLSVGDKEQVEIVGEVDVGRRGVEIDVRAIKKI